MKAKGYWREVPYGIRVSRQAVIDAVVEGGYDKTHAPAFVDACKRSGGFVVAKATQTQDRKFYEYVDANAVMY